MEGWEGTRHGGSLTTATECPDLSFFPSPSHVFPYTALSVVECMRYSSCIPAMFCVQYVRQLLWECPLVSLCEHKLHTQYIAYHLCIYGPLRWPSGETTCSVLACDSLLFTLKALVCNLFLMSSLVKSPQSVISKKVNTTLCK